MIRMGRFKRAMDERRIVNIGLSSGRELTGIVVDIYEHKERGEGEIVLLTEMKRGATGASEFLRSVVLNHDSIETLGSSVAIRQDYINCYNDHNLELLDPLRPRH